MQLNPAQAAFQDRLGHRFATPVLLVEALTHASLSSPAIRDNQRLEFLGDRVLGLVIAEALLEADKDAAEGTLAPRYNMLVRKETCAAVAQDIDLGAALLIGRSERATGGRRKMALLGDGMEAVIAAVYRDAGFASARTLILRLWARHLDTVPAVAQDPKTALQEWAQARGLPPPRYLDVARSGPDHAPTFKVAAEVADGQRAQAEAASKRAAQQAAAARLLAQMTQDPNGPK